MSGLPSSNVIDGNRGDPSQTEDLGRTRGEPNGSFDDALVALFDESGVARLEGTVSGFGSFSPDVDVFRLGGIQPGDRIIIDAKTPGSPLDVSVALFDSEQRLVSTNDDREGGGLDALIDVITRRTGQVYYAAVSASGFADSGDEPGSTDRRTGTYTVDIRVEFGDAIPPPVAQVLLLDFDGAIVDSPTLGQFRLTEFDAADIDLRYAGQTETFKRLIREAVQQNYERFNLTVVTTDEELPSAPFSTIYFGGVSQEDHLGFAEGIDEFNVDQCDDAIVYTGSFDVRIFGAPPTTEAMATAIGNVAAHESGHILGLYHVDDGSAIMDAESAATTLLTDQEFRTAPLSQQIVPIGVQDAVLLLSESVGPAP